MLVVQASTEKPAFLFFSLVFGDKVLSCISGLSGTHSVAQADLKLAIILLSQFPKFWGYRPMTLYLEGKKLLLACCKALLGR